MKKLFKDIFETLVTIGLPGVVSFWLGVGLYLVIKAVLLY